VLFRKYRVFTSYNLVVILKMHKNLTGFFLACTTERFFRIDRGQEQLHYVTDVAVEAVYILDEDTVQQHEGQTGPSQIIASQEMETARVHLPR